MRFPCKSVKMRLGMESFSSGQEKGMKKERWIKGGVLYGMLSVCCILTGCSVSFAGFSPKERQKLVLTCEQSLTETSEEQPERAETEMLPGESEETGKQAPVNINTAGVEELTLLSGVGESRARAIIEYREQQGPFERPEDIMQIPGIKEGIFSKIKDQIAVR